jgi:hypothetical protein
MSRPVALKHSWAAKYLHRPRRVDLFGVTGARVVVGRSPEALGLAITM